MHIKRLLITGAGGSLGSVLRRHFAGKYEALRLSARSSLGEVGPGEEHVQADLADAAAVDRLFEGVDACVCREGGSQLIAHGDIDDHVERPTVIEIYKQFRRFEHQVSDIFLSLHFGQLGGGSQGVIVVRECTVNGHIHCSFCQG